MHSLNLDSILNPYSSDMFFKDTFGNRLLHIPGPPGRFSDLMSWRSVNSILRHHHLSESRLRLYKEGKPIPPEQFLRKRDLRKGLGISARHLTAQLRQGATLIVDGVDDLHEPVTVLSERLERTLETRITVNMYAGWHACPGFAPHWDDHDVFILQVAGHKRWQVWGETERFPVKPYRTAPIAPAGEPLWRGGLNDGDALYIPRGWWHEATPCDEATLHLTVGISNPTGLSLIGWLANQLREREVLRRDIPRFADPGTQANYVQLIKAAVIDALDQVDLLERFRGDCNTFAEPRPFVSLPWGAADQLPLSEDYMIRSLAPRSLSVPLDCDDATTFNLVFDGQQLSFPSSAVPLMRFILAEGPHSIAAIYQRFDGMYAVAELTAFLRCLISNGIVGIDDSISL